MSSASAIEKDPTPVDRAGAVGAGPGDLPEPPRLRRIIGPSLVLLAVAMGSGELVLWPFVSSRTGLGFLWVAVVGLSVQYFVNMEIERYTLATGETVVAGFTRLWTPWAGIFLVFTAVAWVWPAWAAGASTVAGFMFGWDPGTVAVATVLGLVAIGISLTLSPVAYTLIERAQGVMMALVVAFVLGAIVIATDAGTWTTAVTDVSLQLHPDISPAMLLGLLVFAGAGGSLNLVLSNWIRDKGMGMGAHLRPIESPVTGHPSAAPPVGRPFTPNEGNLSRWRGWWRVANTEHLIFFVFLAFVVIASLSALSAATVFGQEIGGGFDFIRAEGEALGERLGGWFRHLFWASGVIILFSTNLGIIDHVGRLLADIIKVNWMKDGERWTESKLYLIVVWLMIAAGALIVLLGFNEPLILMVTSAALGGLVMLTYSALLIRLNRRALPEAIRLRGLRLWAMAGAVTLFGSFFVYVLLTAVVPLLSRIGAG